MKRKQWSLEEVLNLAKDYENIHEFKKLQRAAYSWAYAHGFYKNLKEILPGINQFRKDWDINEIKNIASQFPTQEAFKNNNRKLYERAIRLGILKDLFPSKNPRVKTDDELIEIAKRFIRRGEMARYAGGPYRTIIKRNLQKRAFAHMVIDREYAEEKLHKKIVRRLKKELRLYKAKILSEYWIDNKSKVDIFIECKEKVILIEVKSEKSLHNWRKNQLKKQLDRYKIAAHINLKNFFDIYMVSETGKMGYSIEFIMVLLKDVFK